MEAVKSVAGLELRNRKSVRLPSKASTNTAMAPPLRTAKTAVMKEATAPSPAARLASLSVRLMALVIPTTHSRQQDEPRCSTRSSVTPMLLIRTPAMQRVAAAASWAATLHIVREASEENVAEYKQHGDLHSHAPEGITCCIVQE